MATQKGNPLWKPVAEVMAAQRSAIAWEALSLGRFSQASICRTQDWSLRSCPVCRRDSTSGWSRSGSKSPSLESLARLRFHREFVSTANVVGFDKNAMAFSINDTLREGLFRHTRPNFGRFLGVGTGKCIFKLFCKARPFGVCALVSKLLVNQVSVETRRQGPNWHCAENVAYTKNCRKQRAGIKLKIRPGSAFNKMRRKGRVCQDVGIPGGILACRF